ncbi:TetR/AcrR family transcriptional regulator [Pseudonocardia sp. TRM90224]|uniref:TetR/AcrR family transcriptional regulator n=1 Tax=Pseudonocardia sp. TRM90224 TaxID=2812678 RepID=UPI001E60B924|nr:TetR/AcrR family transcriptional regulator [Pseudonocardia sp. TRM90224]
MDGAERSYGGRTPSERRAERRDRILGAGLELFGTEGYRATSIEKLCAAAGVSTRNFYEEFSGRDALLIAVHDKVMTAISDASAAAFEAEQDRPSSEAAESALTAYISTAFADPRWARIAFVEVLGVGPAVEEHRLAWRDKRCAAFLAMVRRFVERGDAIDRDYGLTAIAFVGAFNELVYEWALRGSDMPIDTVVAELRRLLGALVA